VVAPGRELTRVGAERWRTLDPEAPSTVVWLRGVRGSRTAVLLGAFDPPTNAHMALVSAAARITGAPGALCLTKVLLDRPADALLSGDAKVALLEELTDAERIGLAIANRGTYVDVSRAMRAGGLDPVFVVGADKLGQLADPSFYTDGDEGVRATFAEVGFLVVTRTGAETTRDDVTVVDASAVFPDAETAALSATEVRRRVREGARYDDLVPAAVARALGGYTATEPK
jgi:nicotinic acid mononucleotide adenylyltransferase